MTALAGASSLMFSGKEDLGGGNSVIFKLESGFNLDTGEFASSTSFFDKQAFLGIQGDWGTFRAGRLYTPAFATLALVADPTATYSVITATSLMETHGVRLNNGVIYNSPGFDPWTYARKGVFGAVAHFFGEDSQRDSRNSASGVNIGYGVGPLVVELSHHRANQYTNQATDINVRTTLLAANYKLGSSRIHLAYSDNYGKNIASNIRTKNSIDYLLGVVFPLGKGTVFASFIKKKDRMPVDNSAYQVGVIYDYPISKRTKFTVGLAKINNSNSKNTYKIINGYAGTTAANAGTSAFTIGMTHRF